MSFAPSSYPSSLALYKNAVKSAKRAGLRYVSDQQPGIQRERRGRGFSYIDIDGTRIKDKQRRAEIEAMAIPPSWRQVWICADANGHLRATGRDLKNRKQYRYHPDWITLRNQIKFDRLIPFAQALPTLREKTQSEIDRAVGKQKSNTSLKKPSKATVIAAVVQLLDETAIRIGNLQYSQTNKSYGLTTLKTRHVDISAANIELQFVGKSGVAHNINFHDKKLAKVVKRCKEIPGYTLFQYIDEAGDRQTVDSGDVNEYLQDIMGEAFTAKDFRTWQGTVTATNALYEVAAQDAIQNSNSDNDNSSHITDAVKVAAKRLGNRPATCRKYYIHPYVFESYTSGTLLNTIRQYTPPPPIARYLDEEEQRTLAILEINAIATS